MIMDWTNVLKCPRCNSRGLTLDAKSNDELLPERGKAICSSCGTRFPIRGHVLDLAQRNDSRLLTMAGLSNYLPFLPWGYENVWRPRSLTMLTGEKFAIEREIKLLNDWLAVQPNELIVDLGSSTDLYARSVGKQNADATIIAIDMATGMLKAGREYARRDGVKNIAHVPCASSTIAVRRCIGRCTGVRRFVE
jgi:uncharacterized protein YbaR (Trm112 family)